MSENQIFVAVADGNQREWSDSEKEVISNSPELIEQLVRWMESSLSDNCWNVENYHFLRGFTKPLQSIPDLLSTEEKIEIPF